MVVVVVMVVGVGTHLGRVLLLLLLLMVVRRVEGCGLRLWWFVSHTGRRNNIIPKLACTLMPS